MRLLAAALTLATSISCSAQTPQTTDRANSPTQTQSTLPAATNAEIAHRLMLVTSERDLDKLFFGDVAFVLKYGTPEDTAKLFAAVQNKPILMLGALVAGAGDSSVRVSWDDGIDPATPAFLFTFDQPLLARPPTGAKVVLTGTYAAYSKEPFEITLSHATFGPLPHTLFLARKYWWPPFFTAGLP